MYDAPRERVFETWTRPEHISRWWGPHGFTTVTKSMDVRPGGTWKYVMKHAMHSVWPSAEALEAVRQFGVEKGGNETLDRLTEHLARRA